MNKTTDTKKWAKAAVTRAVRTFAQTAVASIGTTALITEINWTVVISTSAAAGVLSILMSLAGLPEAKDDTGETKEGESE